MSMELNCGNPNNDLQKVYVFPEEKVIKTYLQEYFRGEDKENFSSIDKKMIETVSTYFSYQEKNSWQIRDDIARIDQHLSKQKNRLSLDFNATLNLKDALTACAEEYDRNKKLKPFIAKHKKN